MEAYSGDEQRLASPVFSHAASGRDTIQGNTETGLEVFVVFTDAPGTRAALRWAEGLAQNLDAHIRLIMTYEVPYALPLTRPPVAVEFLEDQVRKVAGQTHLEVAAHIYLCRDQERELRLLLTSPSLIVVGGKRRWWPTSAQKLAQTLQKGGHHVIFAELR